MKYLLVLFILSSIVCNSQDSINYKLTGYCGKIKLSDIQAEWGEAVFTSKASLLGGTVIKQFVFDYGQYYKKDKEVTICNESGETITFGSTTSLLNFMEYNGWDYKETIQMNGSYLFLFRKKKQ